MRTLSLHQFNDKRTNLLTKRPKRIEVSRLFVNRSETQKLTDELEMKTVNTEDTGVHNPSL
jgi:hypothetical protein